MALTVSCMQYDSYSMTQRIHTINVDPTQILLINLFPKSHDFNNHNNKDKINISEEPYINDWDAPKYQRNESSGIVPHEMQKQILKKILFKCIIWVRYPNCKVLKLILFENMNDKLPAVLWFPRIVTKMIQYIFACVLSIALPAKPMLVAVFWLVELVEQRG